MAIYIFTDPPEGALTTHLTVWSEDIGTLKAVPHQFVCVLFSHHIRSLVIYANIFPNSKYNRQPLLDEVFRAHVYVAVNNYIDHCIKTSDARFSLSSKSDIINVAKRLRKICHDYS